MEKGAADVDQVRCFGGLTRPEAERLLDQLKDKGLIRKDSSGNDTFRAVNPELGLSPLLFQREEQIKQQEMKLIRSRDRATKIITEYKDRRSEQFSDRLERVIGMESVRSHIDEIAASTESEMLSFIPRRISEEAIERTMPLNKDMIARGSPCG